MKHSEDQLEQQLQQWYQQSRQQQAMPNTLKKQLAQSMVAQAPQRSWLDRLNQGLWAFWSWRNVQALTAVLALGIGWQLWQHEQLYYQISQTNDAYPIQVHQLAPHQSLSVATQQQSSSSGQRQALYAQKYQDYLKSSENSQVQRQVVVSRQVSEHGWQLDLCQQMQLQLTSDWLAQFKIQQNWTDLQWQQLQHSNWLQITTGGQGQILALQHSETPPACAP